MRTTPLSEAEKLFWLQLIQSENVGPKTFFDLLNHFGSAKSALEAIPQLSQNGGTNRRIKLCPQDKAISWLERLQNYGARLVAYGDPEYPKFLSYIDPPPPLLCMKGNHELANRPTVSIVGSRNASAVGLKLTRQFARDIGMAHFSICSGLARGIDTAAHEASLSTGTIAVLAGGLDYVYPPENAGLHEKISDHGLLISEMMPGTVPQAQNFPRRNRIISGLALGVVVIEAAKRSGSLITARFAAEQGREVFATPGSPLDPRAGGTNYLIQNGANLALSAEEIIECLMPLTDQGFREGLDTATPYESNLTDDALAKEAIADLSEQGRENVKGLISYAPIAIDDLIRESDMPSKHIHLVLLELELAGRLKRHAGNRVSMI